METNTAPVSEVSSTETAQPETKAESQAPAQSFKEKFKLKVDGEEIEEEIDWNDKATLTKKLQLARAAEKRMGEAGSVKAQALQIIKAFESGDISLLQKHPKGREIAEAFLMSQIESEMLTPEQKKAREDETELQRYRREEKERKDGEISAAQAKRESELAQGFQKTIIDAIEKTGLPKSTELVKRMAGLLLKNNKLGLDLTADELAAEVKTETTGLLKSIVGQATGAQLIEMFGPELAKQIRKHDIDNLKAKQFGQPNKSSNPPPPATPAKGFLTTDEWKADLDNRIKNLK
jgi:hypothetical protein